MTWADAYYITGGGHRAVTRVIQPGGVVRVNGCDVVIPDCPAHWVGQRASLRGQVVWPDAHTVDRQACYNVEFWVRQVGEERLRPTLGGVKPLHVEVPWELVEP